MTKKFLSAFTALSMAVCTFTGCSDLDKDGNLKEASSYVTAEQNDVRYKLREDFKDVSRSESSPVKRYSYKDEVEFSINTMPNSKDINSSIETLIEYLDATYSGEDVTSEIIYGDEYDVVEYGRTGDNYRYFTYIIKRQGHDLNGMGLDVRYPERNDDELMRQLSLELIENMEYIGEPREIVQSFDCDYFTMELSGDKYEFYTATNPERKIAVIYQNCDNLCKRLSEFGVEVLENSKYNSSEEFLQGRLDRFFDTDSTTEGELIEGITETEILGYDGFYIAYELASVDGFPVSSLKEYAFDKDGVIYRILIRIADTDGNEQVRADFEKLIDCIKIK